MQMWTFDVEVSIALRRIYESIKTGVSKLQTKDQLHGASVLLERVPYALYGLSKESV